MCVVNSVITAAASIVKGAWQIYTTTQEIKVQNAQVEYNVNLARQNAEAERQNAMLERQEAIEASRLQRIKTLQNIAEAKTSVASGNISLSSQSALDIIEGISVSGELDALNILEKGERQAQKHLLSAQNYEDKANLYISQAALNNKKSAFALLGAGMKAFKSSGDVDSYMIAN